METTQQTPNTLEKTSPKRRFKAAQLGLVIFIFISGCLFLKIYHRLDTQDTVLHQIQADEQQLEYGLKQVQQQYEQNKSRIVEEEGALTKKIETVETVTSTLKENASNIQAHFHLFEADSLVNLAQHLYTAAFNVEESIALLKRADHLLQPDYLLHHAVLQKELSETIENLENKVLSPKLKIKTELAVLSDALSHLTWQPTPSTPKEITEKPTTVMEWMRDIAHQIISLVQIHQSTSTEMISYELFPLWRENLKSEILLAQSELMFGHLQEAKQHVMHVQSILTQTTWLNTKEQDDLRLTIEQLVPLFNDIQEVHFEPLLRALQQAVGEE